VAMMQAAGSKKHPYEIWVMMVKEKANREARIANSTRIISAWRYPGITKPGEPLPFEIMAEIRESLS